MTGNSQHFLFLARTQNCASQQLTGSTPVEASDYFFLLESTFSIVQKLNIFSKVKLCELLKNFAYKPWAYTTS